MLATTAPDAALAALRATLGDDCVRAPLAGDAAELTDYRGRYHGRALALLLPRDTAQVAALLRVCHERRIGVVPQGGNTGYSGGATPDASGSQVIVALRRHESHPCRGCGQLHADRRGRLHAAGRAGTPPPPPTGSSR